MVGVVPLVGCVDDVRGLRQGVHRLQQAGRRLLESALRHPDADRDRHRRPAARRPDHGALRAEVPRRSSAASSRWRPTGSSTCRPSTSSRTSSDAADRRAGRGAAVVDRRRARPGGRARRPAAAAGRPRRRRRDRRRRLHRALDGAGAPRARPVAAGRGARGGVLRRGAERPERRLPRDVLARVRRAARAVRRRGGAPARDAERADSGRGRGARRGRLAAPRRDDDGRDDASGRTRTSTTPSRRAAAAGRPEHAVPLSPAEVAGALPLAVLPARRVLPRLLDGASRAARPRAAARGARARASRCTRGRASLRSSRASLRTAGGTVRAARDRRRDERGDDRLAAGARAADGVRQLHRAHRAGAGAAGRDRLDGRRGDRRRADVPALLPHDERRPGADGERLGPDRARQPHRPALHARRRDRGPGRARAAAAPARARRGAGRACLGRPDRRLGRPPALRRHRARLADPLRRRLLGQRRRPVVARRAGPRLARDADATTSSPACRS